MRQGMDPAVDKFHHIGNPMNLYKNIRWQIILIFRNFSSAEIFSSISHVEEMSKNTCINDFLMSYLPLLISNLTMDHSNNSADHAQISSESIPAQCKRNVLQGKVLRKKFVPASFE